jgi:hypothetical protein
MDVKRCSIFIHVPKVYSSVSDSERRFILCFFSILTPLADGYALLTTDKRKMLCYSTYANMRSRTIIIPIFRSRSVRASTVTRPRFCSMLGQKSRPITILSHSRGAWGGDHSLVTAKHSGVVKGSNGAFHLSE